MAMPNLSIYIPDDVHEEIKKHRDDINVSAVSRMAISRELARLDSSGAALGDLPLLAIPMSLADRVKAVKTAPLLSMDIEVFNQIAIPDIEESDYEECLERCQTCAVGYVIQAIDHGWGPLVQHLWLIMLDDGHLWRWQAMNAADLDAAFKEHQWLRTLPQIFLRHLGQRRLHRLITGQQRPRAGEGNDN
jgi:hypothetical protein